MSYLPRLFIGSATESLSFAQALEFELQDVASTEVWNRSFRPGHYTLEDLIRKASEVDFAVFILGQEDKTDSRGQIVPSPRDNVVYEAGLFAGRTEVSRVFLLVDERGSKIPSDWKGLGYVTYNPTAPLPGDAVRRASVIIRKQVMDWQATATTSVEQQVLGHWWQYVVNLKEGSVLSLMKIASTKDSSYWKVAGRAWTSERKTIAEYWSRAVALDTRDRKLFYYWEGKHPFDKSIPHFFGVGEIEFDDPTSGVMSTAKGWYSESPLAELDRTVQKSTKYLRAMDEDVRIILGGNQEEIEGVLRKHLDKWRLLSQ